MSRTKIIATLTAQQATPQFLAQLIAAGMTAARINTAHASIEDARRLIRAVRKASRYVAIIVDTKGPEIRTSRVERPVSLMQGSIVHVRHGAGSGDHDRINVSYARIVQDVPIGATLLLDDGLISLTVLSKTRDALRCKVQNAGVLGSKKGVNIPSVALKLPALTAKDRAFIALAKEEDVDFIAHSFVRSRADITTVRKAAGSIGIIAKIENAQGVANIDEIISASDGIMVARGDMAVELPAAQVPHIQKEIIGKCIASAKPVITATQMLHSMIANPRPTRAEVSDVANAILDGTDAVMLSGETSIGKYPIESVRTMVSIATEAEAAKLPRTGMPIFTTAHPESSYLQRVAAFAGLDLPIKAIVVPTNSGHTARVVAAYQGSERVLAMCYEDRIARRLALTFGVEASTMPMPRTRNELVTSALTRLIKAGKLKKSDLVVVLAGIPGKGTSTNLLEINTVKGALEGFS